MKDKLLALALVAMMALTGCGNNANNTTTETTNEVAETQPAETTETTETEDTATSEDADTNEEATEEADGTAEHTNLRKVTVVLDYTPNTNHTGLYVAKDKGFYEARGLDIEIVQPPEDGAEALVASGRAEFGVSYQDSMANVLGGEAAMPITAIAAVIQHNTSGIMARAGEGIDRPKGLEGKRYSTWNSPVELNTIKTVMETDGGDFDQLTLIPAAPLDEVAALREDQTDAIWVFEGWGKVNADIQDYAVDYWNFKDIDDTFDFYTPVLIANNDLVENEKDFVKDFVEATGEGYEYAIENPTEAADILLAADNSLDSDLVYASQEFLSKEYKADSDKWGVFDPARWAKYFEWLNTNKLVDYELDVNGGFTNEFVE